MTERGFGGDRPAGINPGDVQRFKTAVLYSNEIKHDSHFMWTDDEWRVVLWMARNDSYPDPPQQPLA